MASLTGSATKDDASLCDHELSAQPYIKNSVAPIQITQLTMKVTTV